MTGSHGEVSSMCNTTAPWRGMHRSTGRVGWSWCKTRLRIISELDPSDSREQSDVDLGWGWAACLCAGGPGRWDEIVPSIAKRLHSKKKKKKYFCRTTSFLLVTKQRELRASARYVWYIVGLVCHVEVIIWREKEATEPFSATPYHLWEFRSGNGRRRVMKLCSRTRRVAVFSVLYLTSRTDSASPGRARCHFSDLLLSLFLSPSVVFVSG